MKAWESVSWTMSAQLINTLITLISLPILGRLLTPAEFGIFGLVITVQAFFKPFIDMGLLPAFVKLSAVTEVTRNVFFTVNIFVGCVVSTLIFFYHHGLLNFMEFTNSVCCCQFWH